MQNVGGGVRALAGVVVVSVVAQGCAPIIGVATYPGSARQTETVELASNPSGAEVVMLPAGYNNEIPGRYLGTTPVEAEIEYQRYGPTWWWNILTLLGIGADGAVAYYGFSQARDGDLSNGNRALWGGAALVGAVAAIGTLGVMGLLNLQESGTGEREVVFLARGRSNTTRKLTLPNDDSVSVTLEPGKRRFLPTQLKQRGLKLKLPVLALQPNQVGGGGNGEARLVHVVNELSPFVPSVLTLADINAMLTTERTKDLLGCSDVACMTELGSAAGVEYVLQTTFSGDSVSFALIDVRNARIAVRESYKKSERFLSDIDKEMDVAVANFAQSIAESMPQLASWDVAPD